MHLIFIAGASGSGKTTLVQRIEKAHADTYDFYYFDSIGVPSTEDMVRDFGSGDEWQRQMTMQWVGKIVAESKKDVALFDGQARLSFIVEACKANDFSDYKIILIDCDDATRKQRLTGRGHPELANSDMMHWAKYLRAEAENMGATVLDTSSQSTTESEAALLELIQS